jgi:hypothetical protein
MTRQQRTIENQNRALSNLAFNQLDGVHHMTVKSLISNGFIEQSNRTRLWFLTDKGAERIGITLTKASEGETTARKIQDEILDICDSQNLIMTLRVSQNMPADIRVIDLNSVTYPQYISELRETLYVLKVRYNVA